MSISVLTGASASWVIVGGMAVSVELVAPDMALPLWVRVFGCWSGGDPVSGVAGQAQLQQSAQVQSGDAVMQPQVVEHGSAEP